MAIEIERKFLLANDSWRAAVTRTTHIVQGYLGGEKSSVRVRIEDATATINIKSLRMGTSRLEFEYSVPMEDARIMLERLALPGVIDKHRHLVPIENVVFEIDEFGGVNSGLIVAEVELDHVDQEIPSPAWLGDEVTDEARYYNVALAKRPYSEW